MCGNPIEVGQAWMEADGDQGRQRIHAGCLYGEERPGEGEWEPQEHAAT
jgi:hypothetical protein